MDFLQVGANPVPGLLLDDEDDTGMIKWLDLFARLCLQHLLAWLHLTSCSSPKTKLSLISSTSESLLLPRSSSEPTLLGGWPGWPSLPLSDSAAAVAFSCSHLESEALSASPFELALGLARPRVQLS